MNLAMKTTFIDKYIYIYAKKHIFFKYFKSTFQLPKIKGPIQILASALEKYNYINLGFETNANNN